MNKLLATGILIPILIFTTPNVYARNLSDTQRYNDGYSNGAQAASTDSTYNPTCDPTGAYTSGGGHTPTYCSGWANGYTATWNSKHVVQQSGGNATSVGAANTQSTAATWKDFGDFSDLAKIPLVGGAIASHSIATGVLHNEQGVFIPWNLICQKGSQYLLESCATLVNPDGSLTAKGDTAVGCIRNGFAAAILGTKLGMSFDQIKSALDFIAGPTGCGGIVDLNQIQNSPDFQSLLASVPGQ